MKAYCHNWDNTLPVCINLWHLLLQKVTVRYIWTITECPSLTPASTNPLFLLICQNKEIHCLRTPSALTRIFMQLLTILSNEARFFVKSMRYFITYFFCKWLYFVQCLRFQFLSKELKHAPSGRHVNNIRFRCYLITLLFSKLQFQSSFIQLVMRELSHHCLFIILQLRNRKNFIDIVCW